MMFGVRLWYLNLYFNVRTYIRMFGFIFLRFWLKLWDVHLYSRVHFVEWRMKLKHKHLNIISESDQEDLKFQDSTSQLLSWGRTHGHKSSRSRGDLPTTHTRQSNESNQRTNENPNFLFKSVDGSDPQKNQSASKSDPPSW